MRRRRSSTLDTTLEPYLMCVDAAATAMVSRVVFAIPSASDGQAQLAKYWELGRSRGLSHVKLPSITCGVGTTGAEALFEQFIERRDEDDPLAQWAKTLLSRPA